MIDIDKFLKDSWVYAGIEFAISRMGLQFTSTQERKYVDDIFKEYLRVEDRKDAVKKVKK